MVLKRGEEREEDEAVGWVGEGVARKAYKGVSLVWIKML